MPKVKIYAKCLEEREKQALIALLREAGFEAAFVEDEAELEKEFELLAPATAPDSEPVLRVEDVLIVLITPPCVADDAFDNVVKTSSRKGGRVIGIWPEGAKGGNVPPALDDHGYDVISWDARKLRQAVDDLPAQWETPAGTPRAQPITKRNRC
jgi:hypothetical protein